LPRDQPVAISGCRRIYKNGNQRMTNLRNFWFRASVTLLAVGFAILFIPPYKHYCELNLPNNIYCAPYEIFSFFGAFLQSYSAAITALAAVIIGGLASSLRHATIENTRIINETLTLTRKYFVSAHRPLVIVRFIRGPFSGADNTTVIYLNVVNIGAGLAIIHELGCNLGRRKEKLRSDPDADLSPKRITPIKLASGERHVFEVRIKATSTEAETFADALQEEDICAFGSIRYADESLVLRETGFFRTYDRTTERFVPSKNIEEEYQD
jgi:hypothetical protein